MQKISNKLVGIMNEVSYVEKKGKNEFHHYTYATSADVLEKINKALVKYKLCSIVTPELLQMDEVTTAKGNKEHLATVRITVKLIDGESGETIEFTGIGSGQDAGDKAVMKAQTAGIKYAYMMSFAIATGDDPEKEDIAGENINIEKVGKQPEKLVDGCCSECGIKLTDKVIKYSTGKYGRTLCMKCQRNIKIGA